MRNVCITLFAALVPTLALADFDAELPGTWSGVIEEDDYQLTLTITFREDGTFVWESSEMGPLFSVEELIGELLAEAEVSIEDLEELGFEEPTIDGMAIEGTYQTEGTTLLLWATQVVIHSEGQPSLPVGEFMAATATQIRELLAATVGEDDFAVLLLDLFIAVAPDMFEMIEDNPEPFIEDTYYIQDDGDRLFIDNAGNPFSLTRHSEGHEDPSPTAIKQTTWGQLKSQWR